MSKDKFFMYATAIAAIICLFCGILMLLSSSYYFALIDFAFAIMNLMNFKKHYNSLYGS